MEVGATRSFHRQEGCSTFLFSESCCPVFQGNCTPAFWQGERSSGPRVRKEFQQVPPRFVLVVGTNLQPNILAHLFLPRAYQGQLATPEIFCTQTGKFFLAAVFGWIAFCAKNPFVPKLPRWQGGSFPCFQKLAPPSTCLPHRLTTARK